MTRVGMLVVGVMLAGAGQHRAVADVSQTMATEKKFWGIWGGVGRSCHEEPYFENGPTGLYLHFKKIKIKLEVGSYRYEDDPNDPSQAVEIEPGSIEVSKPVSGGGVWGGGISTIFIKRHLLDIGLEDFEMTGFVPGDSWATEKLTEFSHDGKYTKYELCRKYQSHPSYKDK